MTVSPSIREVTECFYAVHTKVNGACSVTFEKKFYQNIQKWKQSDPFPFISNSVLS